jgi:cytochrome c oxidase subunit 4
MANHSHAPQVQPLGAAAQHTDHDHHDEHDAHGHDDHGHDDHGGLTKYFYVFIALCVLTGASFFTYSSAWPFKSQPSVGWTFMMAVSCCKALLVILFFMHVKYEANWKYVLTIPAAMMSIFLILMLVPDVGMRGHWQAEESKLNAGKPAEVEIREKLTQSAPGH